MPRIVTGGGRKPSSPEETALREGYRSGLEDQVADQIRSHGIEPAYETLKVKFTRPARESTYTPDFPLPNGIIVETKGRFVTDDRQKHLLIKKQRPDLDIRFVFSNPRQRISKTSATTYAMWCEKHGFLYAAKRIPDAWFAEPAK